MGFMDPMHSPRSEVVVCDPKTFESQKEGAILGIKRILFNGKGVVPESRVHDLVMVVKMGDSYCSIRNLRTGNEEIVAWSAFYPGVHSQRAVCVCRSVNVAPICIYVYEEYATTRVRVDRIYCFVGPANHGRFTRLFSKAHH